jgi:hypothetical protein
MVVIEGLAPSRVFAVAQPLTLLFIVMVVIEGLEPSASSLSETRSNQLSYMTIHSNYIMKLLFVSIDFWSLQIIVNLFLICFVAKVSSISYDPVYILFIIIYIMKHSHIIASLWLMLAFATVTAVSATDSTTGSTSGTGVAMTGSTGTGHTGSVKKMEYQEHRLKTLDIIHNNRQKTIHDNHSGTKAFLEATNKLRQEAASGCRVFVEQVTAGTLDRESALTKCKAIQKQTKEIIKTMRKELQAAHKAAREATKETNQWMRKDFREQYGLGSGNMWTGSLWSGKRQDMEHKSDKKPKCKPILWSGVVMWSGSATSGSMMPMDCEVEEPSSNKPKWKHIKNMREEKIRSSDDKRSEDESQHGPEHNYSKSTK